MPADSRWELTWRLKWLMFRKIITEYGSKTYLERVKWRIENIQNMWRVTEHTSHHQTLYITTAHIQCSVSHSTHSK